MDRKARLGSSAGPISSIARPAFPEPCRGRGRPSGNAPPGGHRHVHRGRTGMEHEAFRSMPPRLRRTEPPYDRWQEARDEAASFAAPRMGTVRAVRVRDADREWPQVESWVPRLRRAYPTVPVVLLIPHDSPASTSNYLRISGSLGIRAVLLEGEPVESTLRRWMTAATSLGPDVAEWVALRRGCVSPTCASLIREIVRNASAYPSVHALLAADGWSWRRASIVLSRERLPAPGKWFALGRGLRFCLTLQARPDLSVNRHALERGDEDSAPVRRQLRRLFRIPPAQVKATIGWEWLAERWWGLHRPDRHLGSATEARSSTDR